MPLTAPYKPVRELHGEEILDGIGRFINGVYQAGNILHGAFSADKKHSENSFYDFCRFRRNGKLLFFQVLFAEIAFWCGQRAMPAAAGAFHFLCLHGEISFLQPVIYKINIPGKQPMNRGLMIPIEKYQKNTKKKRISALRNMKIQI